MSSKRFVGRREGEGSRVERSDVRADLFAHFCFSSARPLPPIRSRTPISDPEEKGRRLRDKGKGRGSMVSRAMQEDASLADQ